MPKRKSDDDYNHVKRKIKKLIEKELKNRSRSRHKHRRRRHRYSSTDNDSDSSTSSISRESRHQQRSSSQEQQDEFGGYLDFEDNASPEEDRPCSSLNITPTENPVILPSVVVVPSKDVQATTPSNLESAETVPVASTSTNPVPSAAQAPETQELNLDDELLDILGQEPTTDKKYGKDIHKNLPVRFQHWCTVGLTKESRKELKETYLTPENCKLIDPPELNAEIKAAVSDIVAKRDKAIENKQKPLTSAITSLGDAITHVLSSKEKDTTLLKLLMDSARMLCDCQHADTVTRRNFLLNSVKREMREQLQNTKVDKFLFGENLADTLKSAKAINKSGTDLKPPIPKPQNKKQVPSTSNATKNLNWRNPGQVRRQTGPQRMKEPAMTSTRNRQTASSKQSPYPQRANQKRH